jgi:hypothetical protein
LDFTCNMVSCSSMPFPTQRMPLLVLMKNPLFKTQLRHSLGSFLGVQQRMWIFPFLSSFGIWGGSYPSLYHIWWLHALHTSKDNLLVSKGFIASFWIPNALASVLYRKENS